MESKFKVGDIVISKYSSFKKDKVIVRAILVDIDKPEDYYYKCDNYKMPDLEFSISDIYPEQELSTIFKGAK